MAKPVAAKQAPPVLEAFDLEYTEGGSSPWFIGKGHALVSTVSDPPENADVFTALAREGSMSALVDFFDTAQPTLSQAALLCYIMLGVVLLTLFVLLPLAAFTLRRRMHGVGPMTWVALTIIFLLCAAVQVVCLLTMISTHAAMQDTLNDKAPAAFEWSFELLQNYTKLTVLQLKKKSPEEAKALEKVDSATRAGIGWLLGNLTEWEKEFFAYAALQHMVDGPLPMLQMCLLALALIVSVTSVLYTCYAWRRRQKALKKGRRNPVFVGLVLMLGSVLLLTHLAVVLPMMARWLPVCVLFDTYLCAPYRRGDFFILDDAVERVWPPASRPDPFCRLVPSSLISQCTTQGTTGIGAMPACPASKGPQKRALRIPRKYNAAWQRQQPQLHAVQRQRAAGTDVVGDCFYPYKVVDTDMTAACPLFTDELVGHYMGMAISAIFGVLSGVAAGAIATIFLAIGKKRKKTTKLSKKKQRRRLKKRRKKGKLKKKTNKQKTPPETPSPPTPPPPLLPPMPLLLEQPRHVEVPVPVPVPVPVKRRRRRRLIPMPQPPIIVMTPPAQPPPMPQPLLINVPQPQPLIVVPPQRRKKTVMSAVKVPVATQVSVPVVHSARQLTQPAVVTRGSAVFGSVTNLGGADIAWRHAVRAAMVSPSVRVQPQSRPVYVVSRSPSI